MLARQWLAYGTGSLNVSAVLLSSTVRTPQKSDFSLLAPSHHTGFKLLSSDTWHARRRVGSWWVQLADGVFAAGAGFAAGIARAILAARILTASMLVLLYVGAAVGSVGAGVCEMMAAAILLRSLQLL